MPDFKIRAYWSINTRDTDGEEVLDLVKDLHYTLEQARLIMSGEADEALSASVQKRVEEWAYDQTEYGARYEPLEEED